MNAHTSLVNAVIAYIGARGGYAWKNQTGVLPVAGRYVHAGKPGVPDVVGVMPWCFRCSTPHQTTPGYAGNKFTGRLIAVECKTGTGRLSKIQRAGGDGTEHQGIGGGAAMTTLAALKAQRKAECLRGHALAGYNLIVRRGMRQCRACKNLRDARRKREARAA